MDTGNIISLAYQIGAIALSIILLYGVQRFMSRPIEGDEEKRALMEQARTLRREARQCSLEILKASSELDLSLSTATSSTEKDEQARGVRATRKRSSPQEEPHSSATDLSERLVTASGDTQGIWRPARTCG